MIAFRLQALAFGLWVLGIGLGFYFWLLAFGL